MRERECEKKKRGEGGLGDFFYLSVSRRCCDVKERAAVFVAE